MSIYTFRSAWQLGADPDRVYAALADADAYPRWWPQVRSARRIDDDSGEIRCRSLLPYELVFVVHRELVDPAARVLVARLDGDLIGTSRWTVSADGAGTRAVFEQEVQVGKAVIRSAGRLVRPVLRFNHDVMMRAGEAGLRRYLDA
jgi:hypothetical protein